MSRTDQHLSETDIRSPDATTRSVRVDTRVRRPWMSGEPTCPFLRNLQVLHLGIGAMPGPFEIVRTKLAGSYFLACFGGEGRVVVDGQSKRCGPGQAFLLPPGTLQRFYTRQTEPWRFAWVRFQEQKGQQPIAAANSPVLADYDPEPLRLAVEGLYHECRHENSAVEVERWATLIEGYVRRFAEPRQLDERIWKLWQVVEADLGASWNSQLMAREVHLGEKQLERLCLRELGRTPRQQLIWLRMRRAAELLAEGDRKVASIAIEVGYQNPFVFSTTFKRCIGWPPSEHSARVRRAARRKNTGR
ncbi:MAG: helix-turn-helix domain-containing protein [Pirellulaceae bacterium]